MTAQPVQILVVDDNRDFAESLALLLELAGYRTACAFEGDSAIELARRHRPLVVLTDLAMPGRDGYRLLASLRAEPACRNTFAVAISGWGGQSAQSEARQAGFDAYFMKPCEHTELMKTLAGAIRERSRQCEPERCGGASAGGTG